MKYTENEIKMLDAFYNESVDCCGFCDEEQNMSFMNADDLLKVLGGNKQSIGGTMASLLEKGAICDTGESSRGLKLHDFCIVDYDYKEKGEPNIIETWEERPTIIELVETTFSDSSNGYGIKIQQYDHSITFDCLDKKGAEKLQKELLDLMDTLTINEYRGI